MERPSALGSRRCVGQTCVRRSVRHRTPCVRRAVLPMLRRIVRHPCRMVRAAPTSRSTGRLPLAQEDVCRRRTGRPRLTARLRPPTTPLRARSSQGHFPSDELVANTSFLISSLAVHVNQLRTAASPGKKKGKEDDPNSRQFGALLVSSSRMP